MSFLLYLSLRIPPSLTLLSRLLRLSSLIRALFNRGTIDAFGTVFPRLWLAC